MQTAMVNKVKRMYEQTNEYTTGRRNGAKRTARITGEIDKQHLSESRSFRALSTKEQAENERLINYFRIGKSSSCIRLGRLLRTPALWLGA